MLARYIVILQMTFHFSSTIPMGLLFTTWNVQSVGGTYVRCLRYRARDSLYTLSNVSQWTHVTYTSTYTYYSTPHTHYTSILPSTHTRTRTHCRTRIIYPQVWSEQLWCGLYSVYYTRVSRHSESISFTWTWSIGRSTTMALKGTVETLVWSTTKLLWLSVRSADQPIKGESVVLTVLPYSLEVGRPTSTITRLYPSLYKVECNIKWACFRASMVCVLWSGKMFR